MTIEELKTLKFEKGQTWWFILNGKIRRCEYLCEYPFNNPVNMGSYDIVLWKDLDQPERLYRQRLVELIDRYRHVQNYEDAKVELIKQATKHLEAIKKIYEPG